MHHAAFVPFFVYADAEGVWRTSVIMADEWQTTALTWGGAVCMRSTAKWQEGVKAALFTEDRLFSSIGISFKVKRLYSG